jgi:RNA polymerase sigma-70 factor (ECF subfamily)
VTSGQTEDALIRGTRSGKPEAVGELIRRFQGRVYTLSLRMVGDPDVAESITEAVFLQAYTEAALLQQPLFSWLVRCTLRQCESPPSPPAFDPDEEPDTETEDEVQSQRLQALLDALTPSFRAAVILRDVLELDYEQIADIMNLPLGTARSRVHRARIDMAGRLTHTSPSGEE